MDESIAVSQHKPNTSCQGQNQGMIYNADSVGWTSVHFKQVKVAGVQDPKRKCGDDVAFSAENISEICSNLL